MNQEQLGLIITAGAAILSGLVAGIASYASAKAGQRKQSVNIEGDVASLFEEIRKLRDSVLQTERKLLGTEAKLNEAIEEAHRWREVARKHEAAAGAYRVELEQAEHKIAGLEKRVHDLEQHKLMPQPGTLNP